MTRLPALAVSLALASSLTAAAQTPAAQKPATSAARPAAHEAAQPTGPVKVAVIAFQAAVGQTNEFQRDYADLQKKYDPRRQQIKALSDQIDTMTKQLQADAAKLTDQQRELRARAIDDKKKQLDRDTQDAQSDFQADMQDLLNRMASKVGAVMTDYAEKHGYTLVLDASEQQQQAPTVLYAAQSSDITKAVIDAYNEKSGIPAPPPSPTATQTPDAPAPQPATH